AGRHRSGSHFERGPKKTARRTSQVHIILITSRRSFFFSGVARGGGGIHLYFLVKFTFLRYLGTTKLSTWLHCKYVDWNPHRRLLL
ncbi:unnamed protein product, partial [Ectocarpus sp. 6 AP-2014]